MTKVTRDSISQRVVRLWQDEVGRLIEPLALTMGVAAPGYADVDAVLASSLVTEALEDDRFAI